MVVTPRPRPETAKLEKLENKIETAAATRGIDLKRPALGDRSRENFGISEKAVAETWARVPIALPSSLPRPAPKLPVAVARTEQSAETAETAPASAAVRTQFVPTTSIKPPTDAKPAETARPAETAQRVDETETPQSSMTTLRAIALACAGLLALGTAVRLVL